MNEKVCSKCKAVLPIEDFYKDGHSNTGYRSQCKSCYKDTLKEGKKRWNANNRARNVGYVQAWRRRQSGRDQV